MNIWKPECAWHQPDIQSDRPMLACSQHVWHAQQKHPLVVLLSEFKNKLLLVIKTACLAVFIKSVTQTGGKIFTTFVAALAYLNRPVWTLPRCSQGHCRILARDGWKWRSESALAWRILWTLRERALCCLYRRKSERASLINIGDPIVAACSLWTYIIKYTAKPSHMGILLFKNVNMRVIHCPIASSAYVQIYRIQVDAIFSNIIFKLVLCFKTTNRPMRATGNAITETVRLFCWALNVASGWQQLFKHARNQVSTVWLC